MIDYQIQPSTRRCCASGRELRPGERYYSVLMEEDGKFVRKDYSVEAWQGARTAPLASGWAGSRRRRASDGSRSTMRC